MTISVFSLFRGLTLRAACLRIFRVLYRNLCRIWVAFTVPVTKLIQKEGSRDKEGAFLIFVFRSVTVRGEVLLLLFGEVVFLGLGWMFLV